MAVALCVGQPQEWLDVVDAMERLNVTPDFVVVDGSEGGTGAAPLD